jgi:hypothetical protein
MRWNIIVECVGEDRKRSTITLGTIERLAGSTTAENVGVNLHRKARLYSEFSVCSAEEHHDAWLSGEAGKEVLVPYPADRMKAWPVSPRMNSPKNNDPETIVPIEPDSVARQANSMQLL